MLHITAVIKTDFHHFFYRMVVLKKNQGTPLWETPYFIPRANGNGKWKMESGKWGKQNELSTLHLPPSTFRRQGLGVQGIGEKEPEKF